MLLLWSGGVDSTWMLWEALNKTSRAVTIRTLSVNQPQVSGVSQDKTARNKIERSLKKTGWSFVRIEATIDIKADSSGFYTHNGIIQPLMWLYFALLHAEAKETICLGYIKGDDALQFLDKLHYITDYSGSMMGKELTLEFPLMHYAKYEIIKQVKKKASWILDKVWYCEPPFEKDKARKPCGQCHSCKAHRTALWQIEQGF